MAEARRRRREYWAGLAATGVAIMVAALGLWPVPKTVTTGAVVETLS